MHLPYLPPVPKWNAGRHSSAKQLIPGGRADTIQYSTYLGRLAAHRSTTDQVSSPAINIQLFITKLHHIRIAAVMAPALRSLLLGAVAFWPSIVMASQNATYSQADQLRAQLALMGDRPDGCPPWYVDTDRYQHKRITLLTHIQLQLSPPSSHMCSIRRL